MNGSTTQQPVRVWCDGCFDGVHFGHANSLRQAKAMGDQLVVGVHNDADISQYKGPPLFSEDERYAMIRAVKWVDELVVGSTYFPSADTLLQHDCHFATHGDDVSIASDGRDPYAMLKAANKLRMFKRTPGTSTTDIVERILAGSSSAGSNRAQLTHLCQLFAQPFQSGSSGVAVFECAADGGQQQLRTVANAELIDQWHNADQGIAYMHGAWDLFHPGHVAQLAAARAHCRRLLVGIKQRNEDGSACLLDVYERALSVIACKYVDGVLIAAPDCVTPELLRRLQVSLVVCAEWQQQPDSLCTFVQRRVSPDCKLTTRQIITRVLNNRSVFEKRNAKKKAREVAQDEEA